MKLNISKMRTITMNALNYSNYKLCDSGIIPTDSIKVLGVPMNSELHFHHHVEYDFPKPLSFCAIFEL